MKRSYIKKYQSNLNKSASASTLKKLRSFLDSKEPRLCAFLVNLWNNQGNAITYKELREAIIAGEISVEWIEQWQQDYARFVVMHLEPRWREAMEQASKDLMIKHPDYYFNPMADGVLEWTETRAAEFVTYSTNTQIEGLRTVVRQATVLEHMTPDALARVIRPMVGLYKEQSVANFKYFNKLLEKGVSENKATDLALRYAGRQHRYRGMMIARQELAMAYNTGADQGIRQAQARGYLGQMNKVWCTADDERVCEICGPMDGKIIAMEEDFPTNVSSRYKFTRKHPPAHIQCRCATMYVSADEKNR